MQHQAPSTLFLYCVFAFVVVQTCFHNHQQQQHSVLAVNTCYGYSATDLNSCGGHGFCAGSNNCYCVDSTSGNTLYSSGGTNNLYQSNSIYSSNGIYQLKQQVDGNLVLYKPGLVAYWASDTNGQGTAPYNLVLSLDGTLEIRDQGGVLKTISSACTSGTAPFRLVMQSGKFLLNCYAGVSCLFHQHHQ